MSEYKILIVDQTDQLRSSYKHYLIDHGYKVETSDDGHEAMEKVTSFCPELVFFDINTPNLNGFECCKRIKSNSRTEHTKVVLTAPNSNYDNLSDAFAAGCDNFLVKPLDRTELLITARELLRFSAPPVSPNATQSDSTQSDSTIKPNSKKSSSRFCVGRG